MFSELLGVSTLQACMIGLVVGLVVYWVIQKRRYNLPPGPPALPLLGNLFQITDKFLHVKIAQKWAKKYGPVVSVRFGPVLMIVVNNIEYAMEMLVKKSTDFAGRYVPPSVLHMTYGGKDIAFADYGPVWKLQRKLATQALRHYMLGDALDKRIHQAMEVTLKELEKETGVFDPKDHVNFIFGNILIGMCFGGHYEFNDKEVNKVIEKEDELMEVFMNGCLEDFVPAIRHVYKSKVFKKVEEFTKMMIDDFTEKKFYEEEKTFDRDNIRHFTDTLLLARLEAREEGGDELLKSLTDMHLIMTVADIFFSGLDTSRLTMRFAILHMMAFPDIQTKVQEEIDRVVGHERLPGMADRADLAYTEAVLYESMRMATVVPVGVGHLTTCDTELAGYQIPKGTMVLVNHWALHFDPDAWEDPERFIPERYLDENGRMGPKPPNWLPFSAGKRGCLGEVVAKPELHLVFACLMQRFTWRAQSGTQTDYLPGGSIAAILPKPCKAVITKRIP